MKRASILIRIETELKQRLEERAANENRSVSAHVIHLIERDLSKADIRIAGAVDENGRITWKAREAKWAGKPDPEYTKYITGQNLDPRD